jgi:membrane associated rhomboid family serine protease
VIAGGSLTKHWWRAFTAPFTYTNTGYAFVSLTVIAIYGTLLERRHGLIPVIALFLLGGVAGTALSVEASRNVIVLGANGAALALLVAWAIPDLLAQRAHREIDGDLLGTGVLACVVALMPLAAPDASWLSDGVGVLAGVAVGYPLTRVHAH